MNIFPPKYIDAVQALVGGTTGVGGKSDGPIEKLYYPDSFTPPSEDVIQAKLKELQDEYDAQEYARKREVEYPSIQECIHAILDDQLDALQAKRAEIKTKYPKG